jgi:hypothetical protein
MSDPARRADQPTNKPTDRVGAIVWWLVQNRERIEAMAQGRIVFDVSGRSVKPSLQESYDPIRSPDG